MQGGPCPSSTAGSSRCPSSFKEDGPDGSAGSTSPIPSRFAAGIAGPWRRPYAPAAQRPEIRTRKLALVLSSYPTKHSRVGKRRRLGPLPLLRSPCSKRWPRRVYDIGPKLPTDGGRADPRASSRPAAMTSSGSPRSSWRAAPAPGAEARTYDRWFSELPQDLQESVTGAWGAAARLAVTSMAGEIVLASLRLGNVVLTIPAAAPASARKPDRGSTTTRPLAPSHHYLAAYWWLAARIRCPCRGASGQARKRWKWLPGKGLGLSASCAPGRSARRPCR